MGTTPLSDPWDLTYAVILHAQVNVFKPDWTMAPYVSGNDDIFLIQQGHGWSQCDGRRCDARPGDLFVWRRGHHYEFAHDPTRPITLISVGFHLLGPGSADAFRPVCLPERIRLPPADRPTVERMLETIAAHFREKSSAGNLSARGALLLLIAETIRLADRLAGECVTHPTPTSPGEWTRAADIQAYIANRLDKRLTLGELARVAHLSRHYFSALFHQHVGLSPMAYVRRSRMERARALLAAGDDSVAQVAKAVGYDDPFHFSRTFHQEVGMAPSEYRMSHKNPFLQ